MSARAHPKAARAPGLRPAPQRTCVGCRQVRGKKELVRVVRDPSGDVSVDVTGKKAGRGAYICPQTACLDLAVKGKRLEKALARPVSAEVHAALARALAPPAPGGAP